MYDNELFRVKVSSEVSQTYVHRNSIHNYSSYVCIFAREICQVQDLSEDNTYLSITLHILSSSRTSVRVKLGLFNAKIRNENRRYIHRLIYQINEQDLLCYSI